jgi:hypothetical protein
LSTRDGPAMVNGGTAVTSNFGEEFVPPRWTQPPIRPRRWSVHQREHPGPHVEVLAMACSKFARGGVDTAAGSTPSIPPFTHTHAKERERASRYIGPM